MDHTEVNNIIAKAVEYIKSPEAGDFNSVALDLYRLHSELNPVYKKYSVGTVDNWRKIPLMPISEFKESEVGIVLSDKFPFPGVEFHSSGTTQRDKSKHRMHDTEAYRASISNGINFALKDNPYYKFRVVVLSPELSHSSLYYMMQYVSDLYDYRGQMERFSDLTNYEAVGEFVKSIQEQDENIPVLFFGTSLAFYDLMESIEHLKLDSICVPTGSLFIETGGWKGRDIQITPYQLTNEVINFFSFDLNSAYREYSMSEMSSQLYSVSFNENAIYNNPYWLGVRTVDPLSQQDVPLRESGIIGFIDLANVWSCPFILTEDMGQIIESGLGIEVKLLLEGRAVSAPEKGCSLTYAQAVDS